MNQPLTRIALCCGSLARAGLERVVCDLALGFGACGLEVTVIAFVGGELVEELESAGIDVRVLYPAASMESYRSTRLGSLRATLRMASILRERDVQALNVHGLGAHRVALLASKLARTPLRTFVFHDNYPALYSEEPRVTRSIQRQLRPFDHFISITRRIADQAIRVGAIEAERTSIIANGIRGEEVLPSRSRDIVRRELGFEDDDKLVIQVARFNEKKNQSVAVGAMREIARRDPRIHLLLAGTGELEDRVRALSDEYGLAANVHFLGVRGDVADLLGASDLFVLPSDYEGLPISLLEAMWNGLPCVASDAPGITETVEPDPGCARLVAPRDEGALADAVTAAFAEPGWLERAGAIAARLARERYDAEKMVVSYQELHERLWREHSG